MARTHPNGQPSLVSEEAYQNIEKQMKEPPSKPDVSWLKPETEEEDFSLGHILFGVIIGIIVVVFGAGVGFGAQEKTTHMLICFVTGGFLVLFDILIVMFNDREHNNRHERDFEPDSNS